MRLRVSAIIVIATVLCLAPTVTKADLATYSQDFEGLAQADPAALGNNGWLVFANVFNPDWSWAYGYGVFPAPNGGPGFCGIDVGQGGAPQGAQQLVVYNDYNNGDHANGLFIEANVFQEQMVGAADVGNSWLFMFDAKRGNIGGNTTALAFIKTLDPNNGYALTNFITIDMTGVPATWGSYTIPIFIDPTLPGQILQFGFLSTTTDYQDSGIFYDNVRFKIEDPLAVTMESMSAVATADGVSVKWTTATELDTVGFRILREVPNAEKALDTIAPLIPAMGHELLGANYEFIDNSKRAARAVQYYVEDIDIFGKVTLHGPVVVEREQGQRTWSSRRVSPQR